MFSWYITGGTLEMRSDQDFRSIPWLLSICSLYYLDLYHWPTHRRICTSVSHHMSACWLYVRSLPRSLPRDGIIRHHKCSICGWLTGNLYVGLRRNLCLLCNNDGICMNCTYMVPGVGRFCIECELFTEYVSSAQLAFAALISHCDAVYGAFNCIGEFNGYYFDMPLVRTGVAFRIWKHVCHYSRCRVLNCPLCLELRPMYGLIITSPRLLEAVKLAWQRALDV